MKSPRQLSLWSQEERDQLRRDYEGGVSIGTLCERHGVCADHIRTWANQLRVKRPDWYLAATAKAVGERATAQRPSEWGYCPDDAANINEMYAGRRYQDVTFRRQEAGRIWQPPAQHIPTYSATAWASVL